jgi:hypothetical protein
MEDSEQKIGVPQPSKDKNPAGTEEIVVMPYGPIRKLRGEGGKFVRKPKAMPSSREFTRVTRNYMLAMEADSNGKITKGSQSKYQMMVENMICIARGVPTILPNGDTIERDAKEDMAAAQAFKVLTERGLGTPPKSDEEMEALKTAGVTVVVIPAPNLMHPEVIEEKPKEKLKPAFIDAEIVTD